MGRILRGALISQFAALPVWSGDDDKAPAYKIYIDPETGKYTTRDPDATDTAQVTVQPAAAEDAGAPELPLLLTAAGLIVAMAAFVVINKQRKQNDSRH